MSSNDWQLTHPQDPLLARPPEAVEDPVDARYGPHLQAVVDMMTDPVGATSADLRRYIGAFHDFGKATAYFQEYVRGERSRSRKTNHADISGLACFYALDTAGFDAVECALGWSVVAGHHGGLRDISDRYQIDLDVDQRIPLYIEKAAALEPYADAIEDAYATLGIDLAVDEFIEWIQSKHFYRDLSDALEYRGKVNQDLLPTDSPYATIEAFGQLISADRAQSAGLSTPSRRSLPSDLVDQYITTEFGRPEPGSINALREAARVTAIETLQRQDAESRRYTLTLPTGLGKTLTGLDVALRLREQVQQETGTTPRIIYVLPYTAIIDQNHAIFKEVIETVTGHEPGPERLLKHHHLATGYHDADVRGEYTHEEASLLDARWESELITTTQVQFFESLLTPTPAQAMRLPNLQRSIVILDELQALPAKYWRLIDELLSWLTEAWDTSVISMTATQPQLPSKQEDGTTRAFMDATPLIPATDQFTNRLNRVTYRFDRSVQQSQTGVDIETFVDRALAHAANNPDDDILIVMNTIPTAEAVYDTLKSNDQFESIDGDLVFLSGNVRPIDRRARIQSLEEANSNTPSRQIVVSTQVIETGVDIDMDYVIRDFAPLEAIVQTAGRCNREAIHGSNVVDVLQLEAGDSENTQPPGELVYGAVKFEGTRKALGAVDDHQTIPESMMLDTILPEYFELFPGLKQLDESYDAIHGWQFETGAISLIDDRDAYDVFIEAPYPSQGDEYEDGPLRRQFVAALDDDNTAAVNELQGAFYDRVVSIRANHLTKTEFETVATKLSEDRSLYAIDISAGEHQDWYARTTGFNR